MAFSVGITMMKMASIKGTNCTSRHTGSLSGILYEALEERKCRDPDWDPSKTCLNIYEGERSAAVLLRVMLAEAEQYSKNRKSMGGRGLRNTASIGFATIVKPYHKFILDLPDVLKDKFFKDSNSILDEILGKSNIRARVRHRDEKADHEHTFRMGFTPAGKLETAYFFQPKVLGTINKTYPSSMRELGWDIADCDVFDPVMANSDPEYMKRRLEKRMKTGRPSWQYKRDAALEEASRALADAKAQSDKIISDAIHGVNDVLARVKDGSLSLSDAVGELEKLR